MKGIFLFPIYPLSIKKNDPIQPKYITSKVLTEKTVLQIEMERESRSEQDGGAEEGKTGEWPSVIGKRAFQRHQIR